MGRRQENTGGDKLTMTPDTVKGRHTQIWEEGSVGNLALLTTCPPLVMADGIEVVIATGRPILRGHCEKVAVGEGLLFFSFFFFQLL